MESSRQRVERIVGREWLSVYRFSVLNWLRSRVLRILIRLRPAALIDRRLEMMKIAVSGRCWADVIVFHFTALDVLHDDPDALSCSLLAGEALRNDECMTKVLDLAARTDHFEVIMARAAMSYFCCFPRSEVDRDSLLFRALRDNFRSRLIGLLWEFRGNEAALEELRQVPLDDMSEKEQKIWIVGLIDRRDLEEAETLLKRWPSPYCAAHLAFRRGDLGEAELLCEDLVLSAVEFERVYGEEGLELIARKRSAGHVKRGG